MTRRPSRAQLAVLDGLTAAEVGAQVLLVAVGEDRGHHGAGALIAGDHQCAQQVGAGGDAHRQAEFAGQPLGHQDRITVVDVDERVEGVQLEQLGDELVADALDAVAARAGARAQGRRVGRLQGMHGDFGQLGTQRPADAHHRAAGAHAGHEGAGQQLDRAQLGQQLRARGQLVHFGVVGIAELLRPPRAGVCRRVGIGLGDGADEAALLGGDGDDDGAQGFDHQHALAAHPVGHVDAHRVSEGLAQGGEGDARVAAGGLDQFVAGGQLAPCVGPGQHVPGHAVLDAAGEVGRLVLGPDRVFDAAQPAADAQQRRVAHQLSQ